MWVTITKFGEFRHAKPQNNWALHYKLLPFCTWIRHHLCKPRTRLQVCKWKPQSSRRWKKVLKFPTSPISCSERTLNTQPQSAWPWPVPSIQIHSCVGGPRDEITVSEPEILQVLQLINSLQLLDDPWRAENQQEGAAPLAVCAVHAWDRWCHSQPEQPSLSSFTSSPWKGPFGLWASALNRLLCCQTCIIISPATPSSVSLAHQGQPVCISPSSCESS